MKIQFDDKSYIECTKSDTGKIVFLIQAKDQQNPLKKITNVVELTNEQFKLLISEIQL